jgi:hypothetical protein
LLSFTLNPSDNTLLSLTCASNKTVACDSAWDFNAPSTNGGCGPVTVSILSTITNGVCPKTITRTWQATDGCTTQACSQTVTVIDTTAPVITCGSNRIVSCGTPWTFDLPATGDVCTSVSLSVVSTVTNEHCGGTFAATRIWLATDACGNTNQCSQTIVVVDTTPPGILCATNQTVECGQPWDFTPPMVSDACGTNSIIITDTITNANCGNTFTAIRTWLATDACGNTNVCSQTVTVTDTTPPVITCAQDKTVQCGTSWSFDEPIVTDGCGTNSLRIVSTINQQSSYRSIAAITNPNPPCVVLRTTRTWETMDACGNTAQCSQTITVLDSSAPVITCATNKTVACGLEWNFDVPTTTNSCGGTNPIISIASTITNSSCPLIVTRTWMATNACNKSSLCSQTVTVLCPSCPGLQLTKACPPSPVPPGGTLAWSATITNAGDIVVSNIVVVNNQPVPNTPVFGPITLLPGEGASFTGSYSVPACSCGPHADTLTATGVGLEGIIFTGSATASCAGTNHITPGDMNGDGIVSQSELNAVLANYWAHSPWLYMTNAALLCDGRFQFELTNAGAWNFTVLVSTNATDWTNLPTPAFPVYQFVDPFVAPQGTNASQRLYRLQWP